ncbi:MAG: hypothetical protein F6K14_12040 [Symploca sp. SIO2C1]|nr:hypothetical protein [Symploca sp. SIO2C1]
MSSSPEYSPENSNFQSREISKIQKELPEDCAQEFDVQDLLDSHEIAVQRAIDARIDNFYGRTALRNGRIYSLYSRIYSLLGRVFLKQGKYLRARDFNENALKLNHQDRIARENFRLLLETFPSLPFKEREIHVPLAGALPVLPQSLESYLRRTQGYMAKKNYARAILELRDGLKLNSKNSELHSLLALAYQKQKQMTMAKVHVNKALQLNPKNSTALDVQKILEASMNNE